MAKNIVGSSWAKQFKTKEWKKVPDQEKNAVKKMLLMDILPRDASDSVAFQASLMIANIAQFDYPDKWPTLLGTLMSMGLPEGQLVLERRHRPLKTIKLVAGVLQRKRFVIEDPGGSAVMALTPDRLQQLSASVEMSRLRMKEALQALISPLETLWETEYGVFCQGAPSWRHNMKICRISMSACAEILACLDNMTQAKQDFERLLSNSCNLASSIADQIFQPRSDYSSQEEFEGLSKCWERLLKIAIVSVAKHSLNFALYLPMWVDLCIKRAILGVDTQAFHQLRSKTKVLSIRLLARSFLHPNYRKSPAWAPGGLLGFRSQSSALEDPNVQQAIAYLEDTLSYENGKCSALIEALASKYIIATPAEKLEWENDPEGFAREIDAETSPEADNPRPCGIGLLECMLEYSPDNVRKAIMSLAQMVAQNQSTSDDSIMAREAIYRIIGECFPHLKNTISFDQWYNDELKAIIVGNDPVLPALSPFSKSIFTSRSLWLIGVCAEDLAVSSFSDAFNLCTTKISDPDVVVSLMSVSSVGSMLSQVIEEQHFASQPREAKSLLLEGPIPTLQGNDIVEKAYEEFKSHMDAVMSCIDALLLNCFQILPKLSEVESMVRVLQCVTCAIELVGDKITNHFESFTQCILPLWQMMNDASSANQASLVRLQCSVLAMLGHMVSKIGQEAVKAPMISNIVYPLLLSSTDPANPSAEPLAEDALRLWLSMLHASPQLTAELIDLGPSRLIPHLEKSKELDFCLQIASAYALHGGLDSISGMLELLASRVDLVLHSTIEYLTNPKDKSKYAQIISPQVARDLESALTLLGILQRLHTELPACLEGPVKSACTLLCLDFRKLSKSNISNTSFIPSRLASLLNPVLQIVCRLLYSMPSAFGPLTSNDRNAQVRLLDRWAALGSAQDVGEVFIPQISVMGRARRHNLAVSMCMLIMSDQCELLRDGPRVGRMLIMALKAALEQRQFEKDQDMLIQDQKEYDPSQPRDFLRERRLSMTRADPLRTVDAQDAARTAANHVCGLLGRDGILKILEDYNPLYSTEMSRLLSSQLSEAEANEAIERMSKAHL